jgi:hypothetical protein
MPRIRCNVQPDDPGDNDSVNLCRICWRRVTAEDLVAIVGHTSELAQSEMAESHPGGDDHPPYEEQDPPYQCRMCGNDLTRHDN